MKVGRFTEEDIRRANRKGSREAAFDGGWKCVSRPHKCKKHYDRKEAKRAYRNDTPVVFLNIV
jgi:hypothetical protein